MHLRYACYESLILKLRTVHAMRLSRRDEMGDGDESDTPAGGDWGYIWGSVDNVVLDVDSE